MKVYQNATGTNMVASWVPLQGDRAGLQLFILIDDTARASLGLQLEQHCEIYRGAAGDDGDRRRLHAERHGVHRSKPDEGPCRG